MLVQRYRRVGGTWNGHRLILFGFLPQSSKTKAMAAMLSVAHGRAAGQPDTPGPLGDLDRFRQVFYGSLSARADALFELTDAVLCADGPVRSLVDLTLVAEHRRGHGAMYDALGQGRVEPQRLRQALASLPLPQATDGRLMLAVDVSPWLRTDAPTSAVTSPATTSNDTPSTNTPTPATAESPTTRTNASPAADSPSGSAARGSTASG